MATPKKAPDFSRLARNALSKTLREAAKLKELKKLGPKVSRGTEWKAGVHLVGNAEMSRLNEFYRGKKGPTDVLSFEAPEVFREQGFVGEIVICTPVLRKQARELGHSPQEELKVLVVHGVLHLLGMDHEGTKPKARLQAKEMARIEAKLLGSEKPGLINRAYSSKPKP